MDPNPKPFELAVPSEEVAVTRLQPIDGSFCQSNHSFYANQLYARILEAYWKQFGVNSGCFQRR